MPNYTYENKVIENKYNSVLISDLQDSEFLTVDESLTASAGDVVEIVTRTVAGNMEDVAMGAGNTTDIIVTGIVMPYKVKTKQGRFVYYDEQVQKDPDCVDAGVKGMAEVARNAWLEEAFNEYNKAYSKQVTITGNGATFDNFADAVALFGEKDTDLRALVNPADVATLRKTLKDDLKYSEDFARTGYVGLVCGVPIKRSAAVPAGEILIVKKDAVTLFVKKDTEIEQERDANLRKNSVYSRKVAVCALTDETHVVRIAQEDPTLAQSSFNVATNVNPGNGMKWINISDAKWVSGIKYYAFVNGVFAGSADTVDEGSATIDAEFKNGDTILVIRKRDGYKAASKTVTASA